MNTSIWQGYFKLLAESPDRIDSMFQWTICLAVIWIFMFKHKERMIRGLEGINMLWEGGEQVTFYAMFIFVPITLRTAFYAASTNSQLIALYIVTGLIAYQVFGRYIFDWALAFRSGLSAVPTPQAVTEATKTTVSTEESTTTVKQQ